MTKKSLKLIEKNEKRIRNLCNFLKSPLGIHVLKTFRNKGTVKDLHNLNCDKKTIVLLLHQLKNIIK